MTDYRLTILQFSSIRYIYIMAMQNRAGVIVEKWLESCLDF